MTGTHLMTVRAEVWAMAADERGIWLVSGGGQDAWRSPEILADADPHWAVQAILRKHGTLGSAKIVHSTSWRAEGESVILTYAAVVECSDIAAHWPAAQPVSPMLPEVCGKPATHAADEPPLPTYLAVLLHALRHLSFLLRHSATEAAAFSPEWKTHLEAFEPALAGLYSEVHDPSSG
jgi:hypothetical protein